MTEATTSSETQPLPSVIPVFPLSGALLLPRAELPLNIFEQRYLAMIRDTMEGDGVIGMIQPRTDSPSNEPPLFEIGCAGRIASCSETDDGRYLITLAGVQRFRLLEELARTTPYRQIKADYGGFSGDRLTPMKQAGIDRGRLLAVLARYLEDRGLEADWSSVENAGDETLINALAMACPFAAAEKQALLEAESLRERAETMVALMEFALAGDEDDGEPPRAPH